MAEVLPFPLARRRDLVWRMARRMRELKPTSAERHIELQVDVQRQALIRRGLDAAVVEAECASLICAVRAELWRQVMRPGGAA